MKHKYFALLLSPVLCFADASPGSDTLDEESLRAIIEASQPKKEEVVQVETAKKEEKASVDIVKISEAFGHLIGKNMETLGVNFDVEHVAKGIKDSAAGKASPMTEEECVQALTTVQEALFKKQAQENLETAVTFMNKNAKDKDVVVLHEGKLQYKIEKKGVGEALQEHAAPIIRYVGKYLDGSVFGASKEEESLSLDETIAGIKEGLIGMKEGEKRVLFIHPDLAYGTSGLLPPNSLLTFEVELVKADCANPENSPAVSPVHELETLHEIVSPSEKREAVR